MIQHFLKYVKNENFDNVINENCPIKLLSYVADIPLGFASYLAERLWGSRLDTIKLVSRKLVKIKILFT